MYYLRLFIDQVFLAVRAHRGTAACPAPSPALRLSLWLRTLRQGPYAAAAQIIVVFIALGAMAIYVLVNADVKSRTCDSCMLRAVCCMPYVARCVVYVVRASRATQSIRLRLAHAI